VISAGHIDEASLGSIPVVAHGDAPPAGADDDGTQERRRSNSHVVDRDERARNTDGDLDGPHPPAQLLDVALDLRAPILRYAITAFAQVL
jgi:hypothetical protein